MHQDDPFGYAGLAGSLGHTGHTLAQWCGACKPHTPLHSSSQWPHIPLGRSDSAGRGCYTHSLRTGQRAKQKVRHYYVLREIIKLVRWNTPFMPRSLKHYLLAKLLLLSGLLTCVYSTKCFVLAWKWSCGELKLESPNSRDILAVLKMTPQKGLNFGWSGLTYYLKSYLTLWEPL